MTVTIAAYSGDDNEGTDNSIDKEQEQTWAGNEIEIRIISARESTERETELYFEYRPPSLG